MKYSLLKLTQLILSAMDSEEINSISDNVEAQQVVDIIETTYNDIVSVLDLPELYDFTELDPSVDPTRPTLMYLPETVANLCYIKYDCTEPGATDLQVNEIEPMDPDTFFERMNGLDTADGNIYAYDYLVGAQTFKVRGKKDEWPQYYTVLSDRAIIFDNYREDVSNTLTANRTQCYGMLVPVFQRTDSFTPNLDARTFTLLFNEAKAQAFAELKQVPNAKAEQRARRGWIDAQKTKSAFPQGPNMYNYPNYGRRTPRGNYSKMINAMRRGS